MQWTEGAWLFLRAGSLALLPAEAFSQTEIFEFTHGGCSSVGSAGDLNGDGIPELYVTDVATYVHSGFDGSLLFRSDATELAIFFGDVNGDTVPDFVGSPTRVTVYSGATGLPLYQVLPGWGTADIAATLDLNGDAVPDFAGIGPTTPGWEVRAASGTAGATIWRKTLGTTSFFGEARIEGMRADINADALPDILALAVDILPSGSFVDAVWMLSGTDGSILWEAIVGPSVNAIDVAVLEDANGNGTPDFVLSSTTGLRLYEGADGSLIRSIGSPDQWDSVASAGDIDGDALDDVIVGYPYALDTFGTSTGRVSIYSTRTGALLWSTTGDPRGDSLGRAVADVLDLTRDGIPEEIACGFRAHVLSGTLLPHGLSTSVGVSCSTTGFAPTLTASPPIIGDTFTAFVTGARPSSTLWLLVSPVPASSTTIPNGCSTYLRLGSVSRFATLATSPSGTAVSNSAIPYVPSLIGLQLAAQGVVFETGIELTNGMNLLVGL